VSVKAVFKVALLPIFNRENTHYFVHPFTITSHKPGYIDKELEVIVGLQTDEPLKRAIMPFGGIRMVIKGAEAYGHSVDPQVVEIFTKYRKTHNQGVYDVYTPE